MKFELTDEEESQITDFIESQKREFLCESFTDSPRWIYELEEVPEGFKFSVVDRITLKQKLIN